MTPYLPHEKNAKRKSLERIKIHQKKFFEFVSAVHPDDVDYFNYMKFKDKTHKLHVSQKLNGIDKTRYMHTICEAIEEFSQKPNSAIIARKGIFDYERVPANGYPTTGPNQTPFDVAFEFFIKSQSIRSLKPLYSKWSKAKLVEKKVSHNATKDWYIEKTKPLFQRESIHTAKTLWDAVGDLSFHDAGGLGFKHTEVTKSHILGLMHTLDLLAVARGEPPLPQHTDFAGNYLIAQVLIS
jgi:hypothetical protein